VWFSFAGLKPSVELKTRRTVPGVALLIFLIGLARVVLRRCNALPSLIGRTASSIIPDTCDTPLRCAISPLLKAHPNLCGIFPLPDARDAFAARVRLAQVAQRTLDVQYYIWRADMTGTVLFQSLLDAAERGVRVRVLLDDNNTSGLDPTLAAIDSHSNIEVRLFNPFVVRRPRIGYLVNFRRANRRMHNKSFTADNQATIIGGRNVGDEYFGATEGILFVDLDVLAIGPIVNSVSQDFDRYWNSASSYPVDRLLRTINSQGRAELAKAAKRVEESEQARAYVKALRESTFVRQLLDKSLAFEWAPTRMISDDPAKGLGLTTPDKLFPRRLKELIGDPSTSFDVISAYFVPTRAGVESLTSFAKHGAEIKILTNALEATDVPAVHAGYVKYRKELLAAGIQLYEFRRSTRNGEGRHKGLWGSSGSSLHAKTFAIDDSRVFVGSFNFDPRSARLNTELGFVIDSPALAKRVERVFDARVPDEAYRVHLSNAGRLYWIESHNGQSVRHDTEPGTSFRLRAIVWLLSLLPIDSLL
jgi:putative cardiolipin synthase